MVEKPSHSSSSVPADAGELAQASRLQNFIAKSIRQQLEGFVGHTPKEIQGVIEKQLTDLLDTTAAEAPPPIEKSMSEDDMVDAVEGHLCFVPPPPLVRVEADPKDSSILNVTVNMPVRYNVITLTMDLK